MTQRMLSFPAITSNFRDISVSTMTSKKQNQTISHQTDPPKSTFYHQRKTVRYYHPQEEEILNKLEINSRKWK